ncbi:MAG: metalloregulator ArsR/SmtB family transcription factor [Spongiibacteraceae bacterium]
MNPVQFYKCLSDDTRLRCLILIEREGELCVCELTEALQVTQPKISRHLALLRECGLLTDRREGQWVFYSINTELPQWVIDVIELTAEKNIDFISLNHKQLLNMGSRPERINNCC